MVGRSGATVERSLLVTPSAIKGAAFDLRQPRNGIGEHQLHLSRDQIRHRQRCAAIGDMRQFDSGLVGEQLGDEMVGATDAGGAVIQRVRLALRQRDELGHSLDAERGVDHEDVGIGRGHADRHQVFLRIVGEFRVDARVDRDRAGLTEQQGIAVRIGAFHDLGADAAIAAAAIFDHEGLAERVADFLAEDARGRVGRATGGKGHDQPDRAGRIILRLRDCRSAGQCKRQQDGILPHKCLPMSPVSVAGLSPPYGENAGAVHCAKGCAFHPSVGCYAQNGRTHAAQA